MTLRQSCKLFGKVSETRVAGRGSWRGSGGVGRVARLPCSVGWVALAGLHAVRVGGMGRAAWVVWRVSGGAVVVWRG